MMRIMMTVIATTATMTTTDTLAAITTTCSVLGALCVDVGVTRLVDVGTVAPVGGRVQTGSLRPLILTGQSGSNVTMVTPVVIVAPCLTQSSM